MIPQKGDEVHSRAAKIDVHLRVGAKSVGHLRAARTGVHMRAETDVHLEVGTSSRSSLRVTETLVCLKAGTLSDNHLTATETSVRFVVETSSRGNSMAEVVVHFLVGTSYGCHLKEDLGLHL